MTVKVWRETQVEKLQDLKEVYNIPPKVIAEVEQAVKRLDWAYGSGRDVDCDDGGYLLLLLPDNDTDDIGIMYQKLLEDYQLRYGTAETENVICRCEGTEWRKELYLTTNDYGITVVYPKRETD